MPLEPAVEAVQLSVTLVEPTLAAPRPVGAEGALAAAGVVAEAAVDSAETSGVGVVLSNAATW